MLVLVIVVLEVPLVINLSRRVDAEIKAEAAGQAQIVATTAGDRFRDRPTVSSRSSTRRPATSAGGCCCSTGPGT